MDDGETAQQSDSKESAAQLGDRWGDDIKPKRKVELEARLQAWASRADLGKKRGPFDGESLTEADVFWLAAQALAESADETAIAEQRVRLLQAKVDNRRGFWLDLSSLHLEGAFLMEARLAGANLRMAHLEGAVLVEAQLEGADLRMAHLEGAVLAGTQLAGANLAGAHLEGANLDGAYLEGANLYAAHLEGANLGGAHLGGRRVADADLERIRMAQRKGAPDFLAVLPPADLRLAFFDRATQLKGVTLGNADLGFVCVADTRWGEVNLAVVDWLERPILRDEREAREWMPQPSRLDAEGKHPTRKEQRKAQQEQRAVRLDLYRAATRANRQLAAVLRDQGLSDYADKFAYRAQVLQRTVLRLQGRRGAAFGSWLLDLVSGHGYRPMRSVATYAIVVLAFAAAYFILGGAHGHLPWNEAIVVSMTAFHGRGFFGSAFQPGDPQAAVAAVEALVGLLIEITFIATFTQRFFAR